MFSDGLSFVQIEDKGGFIDVNGDTVLPCQFDCIPTAL